MEDSLRLNNSRSNDQESLLSFMKGAMDLDGLVTRSISISRDGDDIGKLIPISELHRTDPVTVKLLTEWRNQNQDAFPTRFTATPDRTKVWLSDQLLDRADRLLFMVTDQFLRPHGHLGLIIGSDDTQVELDNVVRGTDEIPGIMSSAVRALERWALEHLDAKKMTLRVLQSNGHARDFYLKLGYQEAGSQNLAIKTVGPETHLVPTDDPMSDDCFISMDYDMSNNVGSSAVILTAGPSVGPREVMYSLDAARFGWNENHSDHLSAFESEFANYVGSTYAFATSSCTGALHLALLALDIGPGDEVIVPEITWVATASAVRYVGATPVFADVDPETWTICTESLKSLISPKTRAIIPVHLYGYAADLREIEAIAEAHDIHVIEDAAPAIGTLDRDRAAGTVGIVGCYSFQGAKMLVTGEGGMFVTSDENIYSKARKIADHGRKPGTFWIEEVGYKYKMNNMTAAFGRGQLAGAERQIRQKRKINDWYRQSLSHLSWIRFQEERADSRSICWMTSICLDDQFGLARDVLQNSLKEAGVDTRPVFPPISTYPIWGRDIQPMPNASRIGSNALNLPSGVRLSYDSVQRVCDIIKQFDR